MISFFRTLTNTRLQLLGSRPSFLTHYGSTEHFSTSLAFWGAQNLIGQVAETIGQILSYVCDHTRPYGTLQSSKSYTSVNKAKFLSACLSVCLLFVKFSLIDMLTHLKTHFLFVQLEEGLKADCSAWLRLKVNTKMSLNPTSPPHHHQELFKG